MKFVIIEKKGCVFHKLYKQVLLEGFGENLQIIFSNFNYICFISINPMGLKRFNCIIRFERKLFFDIKKRTPSGYKNIAVTSIKKRKICYVYDSISFIPVNPHKRKSYETGEESFIFENKKEYVLLCFLLDEYVLKKRGLDYVEERVKEIYYSIENRIELMKNPKDFLKDL